MKNLLFISIITVNFTVSANNIDSLYNLYAQNKLSEIIALLGNDEFEDSADVRFFRTLFIKDAETAIKIYQQLFEESEGRLKHLSGRKIYQYYYARGFYVSASRYEKYMEDYTIYEPEPSEIKEDAGILNSPYVIQLGAFSSKDNADKLNLEMQQKGLNTFVRFRTVNNVSFYCVWLEGKRNFRQTLKYAEILKNRHNFKYRILEP